VETPHTFIIGGDEDQAYGPKALEIINLRGVSTKQNYSMSRSIAMPPPNYMLESDSSPVTYSVLNDGIA
jgi:hypothetical protein